MMNIYHGMGRMIKKIGWKRVIPFGLRILIGAVIGISLAGIPTPVYALPDLEVSGDGATGWAVSGLMPGQGGSKTITLSNTGDVPGDVYIWIEIVYNREGLNPEPETDTAEPGELMANLLFNVSSPHPEFSTNVPMPTTLDLFPTEAEGDPFIIISTLGALESTTITWEWELPYETGNEAQGDELEFNIYYTIADLTTPTITTFTGGRTCECQIDILNEEYKVNIDCCNNTLYGTRLFLDPNEINFLQVNRGTALICGECLDCGNYPRWVVMNTLADPPPPPEGVTQIGPTYEIVGYHDKEMQELCPGVTFGKPVVLLLNYNPDELPGNTATVFISYYDYELGQWEGLPQAEGRIAEVGNVTAMVDHLSVFGVFASESPVELPPGPTPSTPETISPTPPPAGEAEFTLSNLNINPRQQVISLGRFFIFAVRSGQDITVSSNLYNSGSREGVYQAKIDIDGTTIVTEDISLNSGESREIFFNLADNELGNHTLQIGGLNANFQTSVWVNWWLVGGFAGLLGFLITLAWYFGYYRRHLAQ